MEGPDQFALDFVPNLIERRIKPRFKLEIDISISSRTCGLLSGYTVDISESGIAAIVKMEVPLGEVVELDFSPPFGRVSIYAMVRQKNAFRYGFQFVQSNLIPKIIQPTCRQLAVEKSLLGDALRSGG